MVSFPAPLRPLRAGLAAGLLAGLAAAGAAAADPLPSASAPGGPCTDGSGPRAAVMGYLTAMHERRFDDAFAFVSPRMTDGRDRDAWSALQEKAFDPGKVQIYGVDLHAARALAGDPECRERAAVPNVMSSRDKLNEAGLVEFEVYVVVSDGEAWRVDAQETLFEDADVAAWFPRSRVIEVADEP